MVPDSSGFWFRKAVVFLSLSSPTFDSGKGWFFYIFFAGFSPEFSRFCLIVASCSSYTTSTLVMILWILPLLHLDRSIFKLTLIIKDVCSFMQEDQSSFRLIEDDRFSLKWWSGCVLSFREDCFVWLSLICLSQRRSSDVALSRGSSGSPFWRVSSESCVNRTRGSKSRFLQ